MSPDTCQPFISCIKIRGLNLLPPVISEKRRLELQKDKQQAIKLEKRLENCRELKKNLEELMQFQPLTDRPLSAVTFKDDSHLEALGIRDSPPKRKAKKPQKLLNLTEDIIDVTEYCDDGIKLLSSLRETHRKGRRSSDIQKTIPHDKTDRIGWPLLVTTQIKDISDKNDCPLIDLTETHGSQLVSTSNEPYLIKNRANKLSPLSPILSPKIGTSPKHQRMIRSNSYTLDTPSPSLLAHLEKFGNSQEQSDSEPSSLSKDVSSLDAGYVPFENSEFSSINTVYQYDNTNHGKTDSPSKLPSEKLTPQIEVVHTDISMQQITVNTGENDNCSTSAVDLTKPDDQLMQVLRNIPEDYAKQIIELIEKHRSDRQKLDDSGTPKASSDDQIYNNKNLEPEGYQVPVISTPLLNLETDNKISTPETFCNSAFSVSPSQSIYYSISSSDTMVPNSSNRKLIDLESDVKFDSEYYDSLRNSPNSRPKLGKLDGSRQKLHLTRELFPQIDSKQMRALEREWAASVIGAHVKGFLTRRLLRTERVQSLIETIKDALMCALQLHSSEDIDESDVELHRRLINQVTAACNAFHDIFFSLTIQEQMLMISIDRQRKIEKAKRPGSAPLRENRGLFLHWRLLDQEQRLIHEV